MKKSTLFMAVALAVTISVATASATLVPPFTGAPGVSLTTIPALPTGTLVADTGTIHFSFGTPTNPGKNTGTLSEEVFQDAHGFLFFVFQVTVTGGKKGDIERLSTGDWANSIQIDAEQYAPGTDVNALGVDRNGLGTVGINWDPILLHGQASAFVVLYTKSTEVIPGTLGLIDSGSNPTIPGYVAAATPEPSTLWLLAYALAGVGGLRKKPRL